MQLCAKGKSTLRNHHKVVHERKRHVCDKCDFQSTSTGHLKEHKIAKHANLPLNFSCKDCEFKAVSEAFVKKHFKRVHMPPTEADLRRKALVLKCEYCEYSSNNKNNLKVHTQAIHEGFVLQCKLCDYQSAYKFKIKNHMCEAHPEDPLDIK